MSFSTAIAFDLFQLLLNLLLNRPTGTLFL